MKSGYVLFGLFVVVFNVTLLVTGVLRHGEIPMKIVFEFTFLIVLGLYLIIKGLKDR